MGKKDADDRGASASEEALDEFEHAFTLAIDGTAGVVSDDATSDSSDEIADESSDAGTSGVEEAVESTSLTDAGTAGKVEDFEQKYKTLQGIMKRERKEWEKEKEALLTSKPETPPGGDTPPKPQEKSSVDKRTVFVDSLTDEQKEQFKEYEREFSVISKMEGMKREFELERFKEEFGNFIVSKLNEIVLPMAEELDRTTEKGHFSYLKEKHADYETYRDDGSIQEWIESKPSYLRKSMLEVYNNGEAEEIVELITDFKRENNLLGNDSEKAETNLEKQRKTELEVKRSNKKKVLTSVDTKKSAIAADKGVATDFESAFDEALALSK